MHVIADSATIVYERRWHRIMMASQRSPYIGVVDDGSSVSAECHSLMVPVPRGGHHRIARMQTCKAPGFFENS